MKTIVLDFSGLKTPAELHEYLKEQFGFAEFYGGNLDALYDGLTSIMEAAEILFLEDEGGTCCEALCGGDAPARSEEMERYLKKIRRVMEDAAEKNRNLHL